MQSGMRVPLRLEDEEPVKQCREGRADRVIGVENLTPQGPGKNLEQIRAVKTPAKDRDRGQQAKNAGKHARKQCRPVLLPDKVERQNDGKDLDRYAEGNQRFGQTIPLPLYCPTRSSQNPEQNDIVLAVEKITMQGKAKSEETPHLQQG